MPDPPHPALLEQLKAHLEYYAESGIDRIHPKSVSGALKLAAASREENRRVPQAGQTSSSTQATLFAEPGSASLPDISLEEVREDLGDCRRCKLCEERTHIVFGAGNPRARLAFVGEGPGADEDRQGLPFVGRAGQLLTKMIEAIQMRRDEVYICNVVKCRPPKNRTPLEDEIAACSPFLLRQLAVVQPEVVCCLGLTAAQTLLQVKKSIGQLRGKVHSFRGTRLVATYHPAYLLRNPPAKRYVWEDLKRVRSLLASS